MYITVANDIITGKFCGEMPEDAIEIPNDFEGQAGQSIRCFDSSLHLRPLSDLMKEGLLSLPVGYKLEGNELVRLTEIEQYKAGILKIPHGMKLERDTLISMTIAEKHATGLMTQKEVDDIQTRELLVSFYPLEQKAIRPLLAFIAGEQTSFDIGQLDWIRRETESLRTKLEEINTKV